MGNKPTGALESIISPYRELGAYEAMWLEPGATFKRIADKFRSRPGAVPSDFVPNGEGERCARLAVSVLHGSGVRPFSVRVHGAGDYPPALRDARHPVEILYTQGAWDLAYSPSVAVVGTRKPSAEGIRRTQKLVRLLVEHKFTVVSGLAEGIDTVAHTTAIAAGGCTLAVIGTPLSTFYPRSNETLQRRIGRDFLLVSQVPICRYGQQDYRANRGFFPERNVTMSALTQATVIIEAGETSGTLTQARAALHQKRKLFILDSCFANPAITWPCKLADQGAIRVRDFDDILSRLQKA
jgi:DNA processing protein